MKAGKHNAVINGASTKINNAEFWPHPFDNLVMWGDEVKKLFWKFRYAAHMRKRTLMPLLFCWESAGIAIHEYPENIEDDPRWCCDEELSYWTD